MHVVMAAGVLSPESGGGWGLGRGVLFRRPLTAHSHVNVIVKVDLA